MARPILLGSAGVAVLAAGFAARPTPTYSPAFPPAVVAVASGPTAPSPHLTGTDLLSAFYGRLVTRADSGSLRVIIATLPDPISSHLDWSYDAQLESLRRALEHSGYVIDRFWLPWRTNGDTAAARIGVADSFPAAQWPGVMLFRRKNPLEPSLVLVYVVGEVPTSGIHRQAMRVALDERRALLGRDSNSSPSDTIRIVGPAFSGSSLSLRRAITNWRDSTHDPAFVEVITGSASDSTNLHIFDLEGVHFAATVHTSSWLAAAAETLIVRRLAIEPSQVAFLHEGTTQFGQAAGNRDTAKVGGPGKPSASPLMLAFPMSISSLRVQYARHPEATAPAASADAPRQAAAPRLSLDQREPASLTESPSILSQLTAPAAELLLMQIERSLAAHHIRAVGILATDIRDELFLAAEIRKRLHDVQIFFYGSNVLLLRPEYRKALAGSLVVSTYPMILENQYWDVTKGDNERLIFLSDEAEGLFNATLYQLGNAAAMTEYGSPMSYDTLPSAAPPTWVTVVGRDAMYPVTLFPETDQLSFAAERKYLLTRTAVPVRSFTEPSRPAWQFFTVLFLLFAVFVASFVLLQRRTAPRVDAVVASPTDVLIGEGRPKSADERVALQRAARWASLLLHRELYVLLRYFSLFTAFAAGLLLLLRPRAHGVTSPSWALTVLAVISLFLTVVVFKRAILQSLDVFSAGREHGIGFVFAGVWPQRRDRILWFVEVGARVAVLLAGLSYFLLTLLLIGQILGLSSRDSAFFFQRAVSIVGGVSPAVPLGLSALGFATWCSWHLMRISLLAEPTVYEEFLLRHSAVASQLKKARRAVRDFQRDAEREARNALRLSHRASEKLLDEKAHSGGSTNVNNKNGRNGHAVTSDDLLARARASVARAEHYASSAEDCIADARGATGGVAWASGESPFLETRDIRRAAEQARNAVKRVDPNAYPDLGDVPADIKLAVPPKVDPGSSSSASGGTARRYSWGRILPRVTRGYAQFENWYDRSRIEVGSARRSSDAARDLSDALFYLVPNGPAFGALVVVLGFALWLGSQFELSLESLLLDRFTLLGGVTSFDALFRFGILALAGLTAWAVYRLASIWSNARTILEDINLDLIPAFVALPARLARVTRLTPFGHTSRAEIEEVVEEKWKVMQRAFKDVTRSFSDDVHKIVGDTAFDRPPLPRSRPYELDWKAYEDFEKLDRVVDMCRQCGALPPPVEVPAATAPGVALKGHEAERKWAIAAAELYAVFVADYIDWVFQHLRYLASFLLISLVVTIVLLASYPFQPQSAMRTIYTIILVGGVSVLLYVVVQMNRDKVLSAVANTPQGEVSWDSQFVTALVTYGAIPLLTLVSTMFPEVREFLFSWVTPLLRAFAKG